MRGAPLVPLDPLAPPAPPTGLETAQEYRRVGTKANLVSCAPVCDELTYRILEFLLKMKRKCGICSEK